jgi:hypothetical protein
MDHEIKKIINKICMLHLLCCSVQTTLVLRNYNWYSGSAGIPISRDQVFQQFVGIPVPWVQIVRLFIIIIIIFFFF